MPADTPETLAAPPAVIDETNLFRSVLRLAWPVVIQQVSFSMVQLVDTALVGHLGENALAGVRLAGQIFWFSQAGMVAVAIGSTAVIARNVGAGQPELASRTLRNAFLMAVLWGLAVGLLMWFFGRGAGDPRTPMVIGVAVNIVNIIVAYLLINGAGPFPRLEVLGSGAGFTSAAIIGSALVLLVLASGTRIIHWRPGGAVQVDPLGGGG